MQGEKTANGLLAGLRCEVLHSRARKSVKEFSEAASLVILRGLPCVDNEEGRDKPPPSLCEELRARS